MRYEACENETRCTGGHWLRRRKSTKHDYLCLVACCDVWHDFRAQRSTIRLNSHFLCRGFMFDLWNLYSFTHTGVQHNFKYHMMLVSFNSNTTVVTCGTGNYKPTGAPEFTPGFSGVRFARSVALSVMFCRSLFVLFSFFFWPLYCLSFDLRLLITPLVSFWSLYCLSFELRLLITPLVSSNDPCTNKSIQLCAISYRKIH